MKKLTSIRNLALISFLTLVPFNVQAQGNGAANLSVDLLDGTLFILGDHKRNEIIVSQFENPETGVEEIVVGGSGNHYGEFFPWIPLDWSSETTVNGGGPLSFSASDVAEVILLSGGGDDLILLRGSLTADVFVDSGAGQDVIGTDGGTQIAGDLYINTGHNSDIVGIIASGVFGKTQISTGQGEDWVALTGSDFGGDVSINTGAQDDNLARWIDIRFYGNLSVETGQGDDAIWALHPSHAPSLVKIGGSAVFDGGSGLDTFDPSGLTDLDGNAINPSKLMRLNFERLNSEWTP